MPPKLPVRHTTDYLVLGSGSAGSAVAFRLWEHNKSLAVTARKAVTVVEAGPSDGTAGMKPGLFSNTKQFLKNAKDNFNSWHIRMPAALTYSIGSDQYNWDFYSTPQKNLANRRLHAPRGRVLGGSSSINAMVYIRGHPMDFERWASDPELSNWGYKNVLPYFKRAQGHSENDGSSYRGYDGPLKTTTKRKGNELFQVFVESGRQAGYDVTSDVNGFQQEGFGPFEMTVDEETGVRCSASYAYIRPILEDIGKIPEKAFETDFFSLFPNTIVHRIIFDESTDTPRAVGVVCEDRDSGEKFEIRAEKEVILSQGAVGSPQTLMLSGIGDAAELSSLGINVLVDLKGVGKNLQDHLEIYLQYLCKDDQPVSLYPEAAWSFNPLHLARRIKVGVEWFVTGKGLGSSNLFETGAFYRSRAGLDHPDVQLHFIPAVVHGQLDILPKHGFQIHAGTLRQQSRGKISLATADAKDAPLIDPNYLSTQSDVDDMVNAVKLADELTETAAFKKYKGERIFPSPNVDLSLNSSDEKIEEWIRKEAESAYHLSCTCAMGEVVNQYGQVKGVESLRVVDASIMPTMTSGNLNAPTIMIGEKISDHINGKPELQPEELPFYTHPDWKNKQR